jgi:zona occludens toxin (predicted ATPase)
MSPPKKLPAMMTSVWTMMPSDQQAIGPNEATEEIAAIDVHAAVMTEGVAADAMASDVAAAEVVAAVAVVVAAVDVPEAEVAIAANRTRR